MLERVRYSHQEGAVLPFEQAVPRELLERKVTTYLRQSAALEKLWDSPITPAMLQAELRRMARATRMPARLEELFAALGDDPGLIQECLVRPVLADRLARSRFAADRRLQDAGATWDEWWSRAQDQIAMAEPALPDEPGELPRMDPEGAGPVAESCVEELWENASLDDPTGLPPFLKGTAVVWTGEEMIVWGGGSVSSPARGVAYSPATDSWRSLSQESQPSAREQHTAVWTGTEMIVWGGLSPSPFQTSTGGRASDHPSAFSTAAVCIESRDGSDTAAVDAQVPAAGGAFLYLVRPLNGCGAGPASIGSDGEPLPAVACP